MTVGTPPRAGTRVDGPVGMQAEGGPGSGPRPGYKRGGATSGSAPKLKSGYKIAKYPDGSWAVWKGKNPWAASAKGGKKDPIPDQFLDREGEPATGSAPLMRRRLRQNVVQAEAVEHVKVGDKWVPSQGERGNGSPPGRHLQPLDIERTRQMPKPQQRIAARALRGPVQAEAVEHQLVGGKWVPTPGEVGSEVPAKKPAPGPATVALRYNWQRRLIRPPKRLPKRKPYVPPIYPGEREAIANEATGPHDDRVPVASFRDDLDRKVALRRVMYDEQGSTVEPTDRGAQYTKDEVNYRYAADPKRSCGTCTNFVRPGACQIVAGMIRPVDVCDKWEARPAPVTAEVYGQAPSNPSGSFADAENGAEYWNHSGTQDVRGGEHDMNGYNGPYDDLYDGGADLGDDDCEDYERDDQGRCPHDPEYMGGEGTDYGLGMAADEEEGDGVVDDKDPAHGGHGHGIRGMSDIPVVRAELIGPEGPYAHDDDDGLEVTPPGFEPVVKALKKRPGVENPWAVAWAMKGKGMRPRGASEVLPTRRGDRVAQAELVRREQMPATSPGGSGYSGPAASAGGGAMSAPTGPSAGAGGGAMSAPSTTMMNEHHRRD